MTDRKSPTPTPWWRRPAASAAAVALAALVVHATTLDNGYHLDDFPRIVNNPHVGHVSPIGRHFADPATSSVCADDQ